MDDHARGHVINIRFVFLVLISGVSSTIQPPKAGVWSQNQVNMSPDPSSPLLLNQLNAVQLVPPLTSGAAFQPTETSSRAPRSSQTVHPFQDPLPGLSSQQLSLAPVQESNPGSGSPGGARLIAANRIALIH